MSDTKELQICEGDLSRIISLVIDQPISSMEGLDLCNHLKRLVINGFPGPALDAGPLENLSELRILEWNGRSIVHPEAFEKLSQLSELRIRKTELASLDFLGHFTNLMKFEYSDAVVGNIDVLRHLPLLDELVLNRANLSDAQVILEMPNLIRLDLSGNHLKESDFLSESTGLIRADLSDNRISELTLGGKLQSLIEIDVSGNNIGRMFFSEELKLLQIIDLSYNKLVTPGKLFLYAPALINVDLNHNQLRDMGKHRCPNLVVMNVSNNQLITTDWVSLQPQLKIFNAEHNRISDLSDLVSNKLFQQLSFLGLDKNPLSKQSFLECLPILVNSIDSISKPQDYQPLSPCYVSPANGSQSVETDLEFRWFTEDTLQECVYDLLIVKGDSLVPVLRGINSLKAVLSPRPAPSFSWVIASRTADSVYYSGVNEVTSTIEWTVPFYEGFETYQEGKPLSQQSDIWLLTEKAAETSSTGGIVSSNFQTGNLSFKLSDNETLTLSAQHLKLPYLSIEFSVFIPPGQSGEFSVQNMNGIFFKLVWDESDIGRFYLNDKLFNTFSVDHLNWTDYEILAHARNESIYIRAGKQLIMNDPWMVPEGVICTESIAFSCFSDQSLFIDDIVITSSAGSSGLESADQPGGVSSVFPNPFTDHVQVTCSVPGRHEIRIVDLNGREVYRQLIDFEQRGTIDLALGFLEAGVYTLFSTDRRFVLVRLVRR
jgi:Leucine-rich repeat (LRR) protein